MTAAIIGVAVGTPSNGIGVVVISDGEVIEGVTVTRNPGQGITTLWDVARAAVEAGLAIAADHGFEHAVWVIEDINTARPRTQARRAAANRASVREAARARAEMHGAVVALIPAGAARFDVAPIGDVPAEQCPELLSGKKPSAWRGPRGQRREVQRTAWRATAPDCDSLVPAQADEYPGALAQVIRAFRPTADSLHAACQVALATVTRPAGAPVLAADHLHQWATAQGLTTDPRTTND